MKQALRNSPPLGADARFEQQSKIGTKTLTKTIVTSRYPVSLPIKPLGVNNDPSGNLQFRPFNNALIIIEL